MTLRNRLPSSTTRPTAQKYLITVADPDNAVTPADPSKYVSLPLPAIQANSVDWTDGGGADLSYSITGSDLLQATTVALYWAPTETFDPADDTLAYSTSTQTALGTYSLHVTPDDFLSGPDWNDSQDQYLLEVVNPDNSVIESDTSDNVAGVLYLPEWTGQGSDDLWSDGDNWLGGFDPPAGADLLFPSDALQQTNDNDLGFTFDSVTFEGGNYDVSGQTLSTSGTLDFQAGSTELDCSATTAGPTSVDAGATLTIGADATLNVLNTDPYNINGKFSLLGDCDIAGDASVGSTGEFDVSGNCTVEANGTLNLAGTETFDDGSVVNAYSNTTVNFQGTGKASLNGTVMFMPSSNVNLLPQTTLNTSGSLTLGVSSNWKESFGAVWTAKSGSNAYIYGNMSSSGTGQINAGANIYQYSGSQASWNAVLDNNGNYNAVAGASSGSGAMVTIGASGNVKNGGNWNIGLHDTLIDAGSFQSGVGASFNSQGQVSVLATATWNVGPGTTAKDGDSITVATGATLDIGGTLTEGTGGFLDDLGAVTIEPAGALADDSTVTVESGASFNVLGTLTIGAGGSFNVAPGALYTVVTIDAINPVAPNPRNTPVAAVDVTFSEAVDASSFSSGAVALADNGQPVAVSGLTLLPVSGDTYAVQGLTAFTGAEGSYTLTVNAADIRRQNGNPGTRLAIDLVADGHNAADKQGQSASAARHEPDLPRLGHRLRRRLARLGRRRRMRSTHRPTAAPGRYGRQSPPPTRRPTSPARATRPTPFTASRTTLPATPKSRRRRSRRAHTCPT